MVGQGTKYDLGSLFSDIQNWVVKYGLTHCVQLRKPIGRQWWPDQHEEMDVHGRSLQRS